MQHEGEGAVPAPLPPGALALPPLTPGTLVKRYKRFLADVILEDGTPVTAHCPNSGRMTGCSEPGRPVWLSRSENPGRKHPFTWELISMPESLVGVNTLLPNRLAARGIRDGVIPGFSGYGEIRPESRLPGGSRPDLLLRGPGLADCYVEVKNCTLVEGGRALFPDAPTARGAKHARELAALARQGLRAAFFFLVQRHDAESFSPADEIDPAFCAALREALAAGVMALAWDARLTLSSIRLNRPLPIIL